MRNESSVKTFDTTCTHLRVLRRSYYPSTSRSRALLWQRRHGIARTSTSIDRVSNKNTSITQMRSINTLQRSRPSKSKSDRRIITFLHRSQSHTLLRNFFRSTHCIIPRAAPIRLPRPERFQFPMLPRMMRISPKNRIPMNRLRNSIIRMRKPIHSRIRQQLINVIRISWISCTELS